MREVQGGAEFGDCGVGAALLQVRKAQTVVRQGETRIHLDGLLALLTRFVVAARVEVTSSQISLDDEREWV